MLADVPVAQWQSWLRFKLLDDASPYLSDAFVSENFDFYGKTLQGQKEQRARWKRVLGVIEGSAGEAMGQRYVEVAFPASSKAQMQQLVNNLRDALKARIENLTWMSDATKKKALDKWAAFNTKIGYPDKWRDWTGLATSRDSYFGNVAAANAFNYRWQLGKIGKPVDKTEWGMTPQTINAYYNPQQNEIVFPAAILQPPFFDPKADDAMNYGAIGAVIGHEMTHGYDDQGARFGPSGNFEEWWTKEDAAKFKALTGKLVSAVQRLYRGDRPDREGQRQSDAGREHRRPRRTEHCLRCLAESGCRQTRSEDRRHDPRSAVLPGLRLGVAREIHAGADQADHRLRSAFAGWRARQWHAYQCRRVRQGIRLQGRRRHGQQRR